MKKQNGEIIGFLKQKNYVMVNNNLGGGSFGQTVLLQDPFINELFVAKKYAPFDMQIKKEFYQNFLDEIKILYKINHPNIVRIYNYYAYEDFYTGYILMEYIDGITIDDYFGDKFLDYVKIVNPNNVFRQLISAFCYLEKVGILHRDIREHNIMIQNDGVVKIIDFGIGKFSGNSSNDFDSLVSKINRQNVDILPNEYKAKKYTSLTDMFYLGELFNRLLKQSTEENLFVEFSYQEILDKMMQVNSKNRYKNFFEIQEALDKRDFINLNISENDKKIYNNFAYSLYEAIGVFYDKYEFNRSIGDIIGKIEKILSNNLFEEYIQNNSDLISVFIKNNFSFYKGSHFSNKTVKDFLDWFKNSTERSQEIILSNIQTKLSNIKIESSDSDIPF